MPNTQQPRTADVLTLLAAATFASTAAPFMAAAAAPSLGIAFWRNGFAAIILLFLVRKHLPALRALDRTQLRDLAVSGALLGVHFACWVPSVKLTSVAAAASLVSTQVVWAALFERLSGHRAPRLQFIGIAVTLLGVLWLTGVDFALSPDALKGDALALGGAIAAAAYMHIGQRVRPHVSLTAYTAVLYTMASLTLLVVTLAAGVELSGYEPQAWMYIGAVTLFAQFGGHSLYNRALQVFSATAISNVILLQVPIGSAIAWLLLDQTPAPILIPAAVLIIVGVVLVIRASRRPTVDLDAQLD